MSPCRERHVSFRFAQPADAVTIASIYGPFVDGVASFETRVPSSAEMEGRMQAVAEAGLPWIVAHEEGVLGYAYAGLHRKRQAYAWTVESSVYLGPNARGRGLGATLMQVLLQLLQTQGYRLVLAGVSLPNPASLALHQRFGFDEVGTYPGIGFKNNAWHDVWWGGLVLASPSAPTLPRTLKELSSAEISAAGIGPPAGVSD